MARPVATPGPARASHRRYLASWPLDCMRLKLPRGMTRYLSGKARRKGVTAGPRLCPLAAPLRPWAACAPLKHEFVADAGRDGGHQHRQLAEGSVDLLPFDGGGFEAAEAQPVHGGERAGVPNEKAVVEQRRSLQQRQPVVQFAAPRGQALHLVQPAQVAPPALGARAPIELSYRTHPVREPGGATGPRQRCGQAQPRRRARARPSVHPAVAPHRLHAGNTQRTRIRPLPPAAAVAIACAPCFPFPVSPAAFRFLLRPQRFHLALCRCHGRLQSAELLLGRVGGASTSPASAPASAWPPRPLAATSERQAAQTHRFMYLRITWRASSHTRKGRGAADALGGRRGVTALPCFRGPARRPRRKRRARVARTRQSRGSERRAPAPRPQIRSNWRALAPPDRRPPSTGKLWRPGPPICAESLRRRLHRCLVRTPGARSGRERGRFSRRPPRGGAAQPLPSGLEGTWDKSSGLPVSWQLGVHTGADIAAGATQCGGQFGEPSGLTTRIRCRGRREQPAR